MGNLFNYVEITHILEQTLNHGSLQQFLGRTVVGPVLEVEILKILGQYGLEMAIP